MTSRVRLSKVGWSLSGIAALVLAFICGRWAFVPPQIADLSHLPVTYTTQEMTVGTSIPLPVAAHWAEATFGVGAAQGVVTTIDIRDGQEINQGDLLYTVDLRPVIAARGTVPAFRDLARGASGPDVAQLQQLLIDTGFLSGPADGVFGGGTETAVRIWQKSLGILDDGTVRASDLVFSATLPARIHINDDASVGNRLIAGDSLLSILAPTPTFVATVPSGLGLDPTREITVTIDGQAITAVVASLQDDNSGNVLWTLTRPDGSALCGNTCTQIPLDPQFATFQAAQVIVPEVTGPAVPASALWFGTDGAPYVVLENGDHRPVTILGRGDGQVVLDGIDVGERVVLAQVSDTSTDRSE